MGKVTGRPCGRPTLYKRKFCNELINHMAEGYSIESFAGEIGVAKRTIFLWLEKHEEFMHAKQIGESKSQLWWEKAGRKGMFTGGFTASVWIFSMKNRFDWKDKIETSDEKSIHTVRIELPGQNAAQVVSIGDESKQIEGE